MSKWCWMLGSRLVMATFFFFDVEKIKVSRSAPLSRCGGRPDVTVGFKCASLGFRFFVSFVPFIVGLLFLLIQCWSGRTNRAELVSLWLWPELSRAWTAIARVGTFVNWLFRQ